jgi:hypothetical protein
MGCSRFKSCHSDQLHTRSVDLPQPFGFTIELGDDRVHKRVHRRVVRMVSLGQDDKGNYKAKKRLPDDIREDYGRLYGQRLVAKFHRPASTKPNVARQEFNEWLAEVESRIDSIRAQRDGSGRKLTRIEARKLAGDWYEWFIERRSETSLEDLEWRRDEVNDAFKSAGVSEKDFELFDTDELWQKFPSVREAVRPVIADMAETAQFLAYKQLTLAPDARDLFLDYLYEDLAAALRLLMRRVRGDFSDNKYGERFPQTEQSTDTGIAPFELFRKWVEERKPERGTIESWRYVFQEMEVHFAGRSAASITPEEAKSWIKSLITSKRSAHTVRRTWLNASNRVFNWAAEEKLIPRNVFSGIPVTIPRKAISRADGKAFTDAEQKIILGASLAIKVTDTPKKAAERWVPWLCAYTGARPGEITQLRAEDVFERDSVAAIKITPAAGTVKGGKAREVPLHAHLIEQGFLDFVAKHGPGPLFYEPDMVQRHFEIWLRHSKNFLATLCETRTANKRERRKMDVEEYGKAEQYRVAPECVRSNLVTRLNQFSL